MGDEYGRPGDVSDVALSDAEVVRRMGMIPAATVGDAQDRLGVVDSAIKAVWPGAAIVGRAVTLEVPGGDNAGIHELIPTLQPGDVLVINGHGDEQRALIGELIAGKLRARGVLGIVIDGAVRDADELGRMRFPAFARAVTPAGPYRNGPFRGRVPIAVGGVVVTEGDVILADADGVVVVEWQRAREVLARAETKLHEEELVRAQFGIEV